jgi:hypothetical protein
MSINEAKILREAISQGRQHFAKGSLIEWAMRKIEIEVSSGDWRKFSFEGHEPLREIYQDELHPRTTIIKAAQLGVSVYSVLKAMYLGDKYGISTAYYFPTDTDVQDFVDEKFDKIIENSEYLSTLSLPGDIDNKGLKQFSRFALFFRGTEKKRKVKSITVGHVVKDELDEANQENMKFADDRMLHQKRRIITELSQPSEEDFGIDEAFKQSDMRYWAVRCGCGKWNFPDKDFPENLITKGKNVYFGCIKCSRKLNMAAGRYVAEHPSRSKDHRGFQLSHLLFGVYSPAEIKIKYESAVKSSDKKNLNISVLGKAYSTAQSKPITDEILNNAERPYGLLREAKFSYFGMDMGDNAHMCFGIPSRDGRRIQVVAMYEWNAEDKDGIIALMKRFGVYSGVIDAMPYKPTAKAIARAFEGRVAINYYKGETLKTGTEGEGPWEVKKTTIERNESLDDTVELVQDGGIILPSRKILTGSDLEIYEMFRKHLKQLLKEQVEKADGSFIWQYKKKVANHFGMALNYMRIAREISTLEVSSGVDPVCFELDY